MRKPKNELTKLQELDPAKLTMGQRIRLIRCNMTQTDFGMLFDKSQDTISVYETDYVEPLVDTLVKIADTGSVTLDWLIHGPSTASHKDGVVFQGRILKPKTPEWRLLEIMTRLSDEKVKNKIVELVDSYISIEKK